MITRFCNGWIYTRTRTVGVQKVLIAKTKTHVKGEGAGGLIAHCNNIKVKISKQCLNHFLINYTSALYIIVLWTFCFWKFSFYIIIKLSHFYIIMNIQSFQENSQISYFHSKKNRITILFMRTYSFNSFQKNSINFKKM